MPDYFQLSTQKTEDKVISRQTRIFSDKEKIAPAAQYNIKTTSNANILRLKMYIDGIEVNTPIGIKTYYVGEWVELEHTQTKKMVCEWGVFTFTYNCVKNSDNTFTISIMSGPKNTYTWNFIYCSSLQLNDSYFNPLNNWDLSSIASNEKFTNLLSINEIALNSVDVTGKQLYQKTFTMTPSQTSFPLTYTKIICIEGSLNLSGDLHVSVNSTDNTSTPPNGSFVYAYNGNILINTYNTWTNFISATITVTYTKD